MVIDCESCTVRGDACADCVVTFLSIPVRPGAAAPPDRPGSPGPPGSAGGQHEGPPERQPDLDEAERRAIQVLAASGLVPPLRMERAV